MTNPVAVLRQPISARPIVTAITAAAALAVAVGIGLMTIDPFERAAVGKKVVDTITALMPKPAPPPVFTGEELYERVAPSVVTIYVKDENGDQIYSGSGFFLDASFLANEHPLATSWRDHAKFHPEAMVRSKGPMCSRIITSLRPPFPPTSCSRTAREAKLGTCLPKTKTWISRCSL